jgi:DNA helicase HerA-like ATPase
MQSPQLYATFLLWLMSELFEELPEVGDPDKPKLVFFFDEAHLLFNEAPPSLLTKVEQVVRLIRSKGRRRLFRDAEPARCARYRAGPAGQPGAARIARLHPA